MKKRALLLWMMFAAGMARAETRQEYLMDALGKDGEPGLQLAPGVTAGLVLEVEASAIHQGNEEMSDVCLATFELGIDAALMPGCQGQVSLLWEEDDTEPLDLDTGYVILGGTETLPLSLSAGKMYVPFGAFNSYMVSDPLTLELGETRETAVELSYDADLFLVRLGGFSGELESASRIENGVAALDFYPVDGLTLGGSFITDIGEGSGYVDDLNEALADKGSYDRSAGINAHLLLELGSATVAVEYLGAVDDMIWTDAQGMETAARPETWNADFSYDFNDAWTGAVRYEGSREFIPDEMPEHQYGGTMAWQCNPFTTWSVEYLFGTFKAKEVDDRHQVTVQIALVF